MFVPNLNIKEIIAVGDERRMRNIRAQTIIIDI
jgi:hypothetical protein